MPRQKKKRTGEENSLAFLDVVSCSFGAIVLLLLIVRTTGPDSVDTQGNAEQQAQVTALQSQAQEIQDQVDSQEQELLDQKRRLAQLVEQLGKRKKAVEESGVAMMAEERLKKQMEAALQSLDEEMRLLKTKPDVSRIGGIPADSRHVIFIVDTSGSMTQYAWHKMREQMAAILDAYPKLEGIQIMDDEGKHLFSGYKGRWMKDSPRIRKTILKALPGWASLSNSNPIEGIYTAISLYAKQTKKMSIYIMGDDFQGSVQNVLEQVDRLIKSAGAKKVRVHMVGFLTPGVATGYNEFARLTALTRKSRGTFIGLSTAESVDGR